MASKEAGQSAARWRASSLFLINLILMSLGFGVALVDPVISNGWVTISIFFIPLLIVGTALLTFAFCIVEENGSILYFLILATSLAFLISSAGQFALPDKARLGSLATLLALNAAFLGFLASSSGKAILRLEFKRQGRGLALSVIFQIPDDEPVKTDQPPG